MLKRITKNVKETKQSKDRGGEGFRFPTTTTASTPMFQPNSNSSQMSTADLDVSSILGYQPTFFTKINKNDEKGMGRCLTSSPIKSTATPLRNVTAAPPPDIPGCSFRMDSLELSDYPNMLYSGYINTVFMDIRSKQAYHKQAKEMYDQLHGLTAINRNQLKALEVLESTEATLEAKCETLNQLELQKESLKGSDKWMSEMSERSAALDSALNASMNLLPYSKITLSTDEQLVTVVEQTSKLLNEIVKVTVIESDELQKEVEVVESLSRIVTQENEDLLDCVQLVNSSTVFDLTEAMLLTK